MWIAPIEHVRIKLDNIDCLTIRSVGFDGVIETAPKGHCVIAWMGGKDIIISVEMTLGECHKFMDNLIARENVQ